MTAAKKSDTKALRAAAKLLGAEGGKRGTEAQLQALDAGRNKLGRPRHVCSTCHQPVWASKGDPTHRGHKEPTTCTGVTWESQTAKQRKALEHHAGDE